MFPIEKEFSKKAMGRFGYKNARIEVGVMVLIKRLWFEIDAEDLDMVYAFVGDAIKFRDMEKEERERIGAA